MLNELDRNGDKKIDDNELSIIMTKINEKKDGFVTFHDLTTLTVLLGIKPTPAYLNDIWGKFKSHEGDFIDFEGFKGAVSKMSPKVAFMINNAKPG